MIVHDEFIIASSTKSGTHSCIAMATSTEGMEYIRTNHMMLVPAEHAHKDRLFLVRNPYDRMVSIYLHMQRKKEWLWRENMGLEFRTFVPWLLRKRQELLGSEDSYGAPGVWIRTASENWNELVSDDHLSRSMHADCYWFQIEKSGVEFFPWLVERYKLKTRRDEMPRTNSADTWKIRSGVNGVQWESVDAAVRAEVDRDWAKPDLMKFGYSVPSVTWGNGRKARALARTNIEE